MYADETTDAMHKAIDETDRRRAMQIAIQPGAWHRSQAPNQEDQRRQRHARQGGCGHPDLAEGGYRNAGKAGNTHLGVPVLDPNEADKRHEEILKAGLPAQDLADLIRQLSEQMHTAAEQLQFELAARLRDEIRDLKKNSVR